jgi:hypothetical protein
LTARAKREFRRSLPLLLGAVAAAWALYAAAVLFFPFEGEFWDVRGKFGDMFGAFNALFTAGAFAAIVFEIHLETKAVLKHELHSALSAQLDSMVQLYALPEKRRAPVWKAISAASGGGGVPIEEAIANQIDAMRRLLAGEDIGTPPTYGHPGGRRGSGPG